MKDKFFEYFFGTNDYALVFVCFIFGCIGMFIMMLVDIMGRDKTSKPSPYEFSFKWFFKDNKPRFLLNFFIMLVCIRFCADFLHEPTSPKTSLIIGFFSDVIAIMVKNRKKKATIDAEASDGKDLFKITEINTNKNEIKVESIGTDSSKNSK